MKQSCKDFIKDALVFCTFDDILEVNLHLRLNQPKPDVKW